MSASSNSTHARGCRTGSGQSYPEPVFDPKVLRSAFARFATGVSVVTTTGPDGSLVGMTANSFNTVSLDPPLILWSIRLAAPSLQFFRANEFFAVNVLGAEQQDLCFKFAKPAPDKFSGVPVKRGIGGMPLLEGTLTRLQCRVWARYPGGDHEIFVGRVLDIETSDGNPLVFHGGSLHHLSPVSS